MTASYTPNNELTRNIQQYLSPTNNPSKSQSITQAVASIHPTETPFDITPTNILPNHHHNSDNNMRTTIYISDDVKH